MKLFKFKIVLLVVSLCISSTAYLIFNPLIIDTNNEFINPRITNLEKGDTLKGLDFLNFTNGNFKAILVIRDQVGLSENIPKGKILELEDKDILNQIQQKWIFVYNEVDLATVENEFLLYNDRRLIFRCGIVLDENMQGLQDSNFGWIIAINDISLCFRRFQRVYSPIVYL